MKVRRGLLIALAAVYAIALVAHHVANFRGAPDDFPAEIRGAVELPAFDANGQLPSDIAAMVFDVYEPREPNAALPVLLLHGSPGGKENFDAMGPMLSSGDGSPGRLVIAPDLLGYGSSDHLVPDLGARAQARTLLALLDHLGIGRAHVVGWSNGGAVALQMADLAPERTASVVMLASVGAEITEGSGNHWFERGKYALGYAALMGMELIPHFGALGDPAVRTGWIRAFIDTDLRRIDNIMPTLRVPVMILHGSRDFLTPAWNAEINHDRIPTSRLVMLGGQDHFMPFLSPEVASAWIRTHADRHDAPGIAPITTTDFLPTPPPRTALPQRAVDALRALLIRAPWWSEAILLGALAMWRRWLITAAAALMIADSHLDIGVASVALIAARFLTMRHDPPSARTQPVKRTIGVLLGVPAVLSVGFVLGQLLARATMDPWVGAALTLLTLMLLPVVLCISARIWTRRGRQRLLASLHRIRNQEFWPAWAHYGPILPILATEAIRSGGWRAALRVNPGIPGGGGLVGESKADIQDALPQGSNVLPIERIPPGTTPERLEHLRRSLAGRPELGGYPVILKPERGYKGFAIRLARTPEDAERYFDDVPIAVTAQRYDAGPVEAGLLWVRDTAQVASEDAARPAGRITDVCFKTLPEIVGDGQRTLEEHIWQSPRVRALAGSFCVRHRDRLGEIIPRGDTVRLTQTGNHAQGAIFTDRADLITPELERAIDALARNFAAGPLDIGRFDVRAASEGDLCAGRFAVIEFNGVAGEPTNMYDPCRPPTHAWRTLSRWVRAVYALGRARKAAGFEPPTLRELLRLRARDRRERRLRVSSS